MDPEFLSPSDLHSLTGYSRAAEQEAKTHLLRQPAEFYEQYIMRPDLDVLGAQEAPPDDVEWGGLYMLFGEDGGLYYIGKSDWVVRRIAYHLSRARSGKRRMFTHYGFMPVPWEIVAGMEAAHIAALEPPENRHVPCARLPHHQHLVKMIQDAWGPKQ